MNLRPFPSLLLLGGLAAGCGPAASGRPAVANHTGGGISAVPNDSPIRAIDWANRTYDVGEGKYTVKDGKYEYAFDEDGNVVPSDYQPKDPDGYVERGFFLVTPPVFGDLDGDGAEEAVIVTMENTGGTGHFTGVDVYTLRDGKPEAIAGIPGGDRGDGGISDVRIEAGAVIVDRFMSRDVDGACCPSQVQIERWQWRNGTLVEDEGARQLVDKSDE